MKKFTASLMIVSALALTGCAGGPNERNGTIIGGLAGAAIGAPFGAGAGHLAGAAIGAAGGALVGNVIGRSMDKDHSYNDY